MNVAFLLMNSQANRWDSWMAMESPPKAIERYPNPASASIRSPANPNLLSERYASNPDQCFQNEVRFANGRHTAYAFELTQIPSSMRCCRDPIQQRRGILLRKSSTRWAHSGCSWMLNFSLYSPCLALSSTHCSYGKYAVFSTMLGAAVQEILGTKAWAIMHQRAHWTTFKLPLWLKATMLLLNPPTGIYWSPLIWPRHSNAMQNHVIFQYKCSLVLSFFS